MDKIQVGDTVVVRHSSQPQFFSIGAVGTVKSVSKAWQVQFTAGKYDTDCSGTWLVDCEADHIEKIIKYSSTFAEPVAAASPAGHRADGGGLQNHSVGEAYPLAIVGYGTGHSTTFTIENLERGTVAGWAGGIRVWSSAHLAVDFLTRKVLGTSYPDTDLVWHRGRPTFDGNGMLAILPPPPRKVYGVAVPPGAALTTWYYMNLEQDIG